ncbi:MAG: hypothetical protein CL699_00060 [Chloroflexi bacterium]|nr:hypothetical protein [Chloroflexota bacterium]
MKIPKGVTIAGVFVKIIREDLRDEDHHPKGYFGYYSHERRVIAIDKGLTPAAARDTIRHEMIHAALAMSGLDHLEHFEEEAVVRCMEEIFFPAYERFLRNLNRKKT